METVEKNPPALAELDKFKLGAEMTRVQEKIADRLTVPYSHITAGQFKLQLCTSCCSNAKYSGLSLFFIVGPFSISVQLSDYSKIGRASCRERV